jgi:hypothetical protein
LTGTGRHDGRDFGFQRIEHAVPAALAQVFNVFECIAQSVQVTIATAHKSHPDQRQNRQRADATPSKLQDTNTPAAS